jgi:hypothetical protein
MIDMEMKDSAIDIPTKIAFDRTRNSYEQTMTNRDRNLANHSRVWQILPARSSRTSIWAASNSDGQGECGRCSGIDAHPDRFVRYPCTAEKLSRAIEYPEFKDSAPALTLMADAMLEQAWAASKAERRRLQPDS